MLVTKYIAYSVFILDKRFNFIRNMFYTKAIKINAVVTYVQCNPVSAYVVVLV